MIPAPKPKEKTIVPCPPGTCPKCGGTTQHSRRKRQRQHRRRYSNWSE